LTLSALERGEDDSAAHYVARLAELPQGDNTLQDGNSGGVVRYRFRPEVSDHLRRILDDLSTQDNKHHARTPGSC